MEKLNHNELFKLALALELPELLSLCSSSSRINKLLCKKKDIWLYKLNNEFPEYMKRLNEWDKEKVLENPKALYLDIVKYALPKTVEKDKSYYIVDLYKAVEKGYNTREEFERFVNKTGVYSLIVDKKSYGDISLMDYLEDVEAEVGRRLYDDIVVYFYYPNKSVSFGTRYQAYLDPDNKVIIWSK